MTDAERIARLERMVFLLLVIVNGELGKEYWNPHLKELYEQVGLEPNMRPGGPWVRTPPPAGSPFAERESEEVSEGAEILTELEAVSRVIDRKPGRQSR